MTDKTPNPLRYAVSDYDFLSRSLGFTDDNHDGTLTQRELKSKSNEPFRDFYRTNLSEEEQSILASFESKRTLTAKLFSFEPELDEIALKQLRYHEQQELITTLGLPEHIDAKKLEFDLRKNAGAIFDTVTVNLSEIATNLEPVYWNTLMTGDLRCFKTNASIGSCDDSGFAFLIGKVFKGPFHALLLLCGSQGISAAS